MAGKSIITPEQLARAYANALKNEAKREKRARLKNPPPPIYSLDDLPTDLDEGHDWESDHGAAVERMIDAMDGTAKAERRLAVERARFAVRYHHPEWLAVFELVLKNGNNRSESIWELVKRSGFVPQKVPKGNKKRGTRRKCATTAKSPN